MIAEDDQGGDDNERDLFGVAQLTRAPFTAATSALIATRGRRPASATSVVAVTDRRARPQRPESSVPLAIDGRRRRGVSLPRRSAGVGVAVGVGLPAIVGSSPRTVME